MDNIFFFNFFYSVQRHSEMGGYFFPIKIDKKNYDMKGIPEMSKKIASKNTSRKNTSRNQMDIHDIYNKSVYIVILPCEGSPYVWKNMLFSTTTKGDKVHITRELNIAVCINDVFGIAEEIDPMSLRIHPSFTNRWRIAEKLLLRKGVKVFVNPDGMENCSPNMACLRLERDLPSSFTVEQYKKAPYKVSRTPYFGDIALVVSHKEYETSLGQYNALHRVRVVDYYKEIGIEREPYEYTGDDHEAYIFEPNDSIETKMFKDFATTKGWCLDSFGHVYIEKTGRPDERQSNDYDSDEEYEETEEEKQ
jgi:hypothetical protein